MDTFIRNIKKFNENPRILVAPLDWGLGHATRCVPIIKRLLSENIEVIVATDGVIFTLLKSEFPELKFFKLRGYNINYPKNKKKFLWHLLKQLPKIKAAINYENLELKKMVKAGQIDAVISDNRFGLYSSQIPSAYITHQIYIETGNKILNYLAQKIHFHFINKFTEVWIPDFEGTNNLAGYLSHPKILPKPPVCYLGCLSRFSKINAEIKYDLLIILSGPEPQRTIFENILVSEINDSSKRIAFVRGLPNSSSILKKESVKFFNHLSASELNILLLQSKQIIARCGYSTVMDLVACEKRAILVPTPGQTEQVYLAKYLFEKKYFYTLLQENFSINTAIKNAEEFEYKEFPNEDLREKNLSHTLL